MVKYGQNLHGNDKSKKVIPFISCISSSLNEFQCSMIHHTGQSVRKPKIGLEYEDWTCRMTEFVLFHFVFFPLLPCPLVLGLLFILVDMV